jgi:hypothetical protein
MLMDQSPGHGLGQDRFQGGQLPVRGGRLHAGFKAANTPVLNGSL